MKLCNRADGSGKEREELSRRALLKGLGMGAGMIAVQTLPGCGWVSERLRTEPAPLTPQARKVKDDLIKESVKAWKSVLKAQNKIETVNADELERRVGYAKRTMLQVLDELDAADVTTQIDEQLLALPGRFGYPEAVKRRYRKEFAGVLTAEQNKSLEEVLAQSGNKESVAKVLEAGGISPYLRNKLNEIDNPSIKPTQAFTPLALWPCQGAIGACITAFGIALMVCAANEDWCDDATAVAAAICMAAVLGCLIN